MARYVFADKELALEKEVITEDSVRQISKDGKLVCLLEDDFKWRDFDEAVLEVKGEVLEHVEALRKIEKEF